MKLPSPPQEVDGLDVIRKAMIERRAEAFKHWPEAIGDTVLFSHAIAWLSYTQSLNQYVQTEIVCICNRNTATRNPNCKATEHKP